MYAGSEVLRAVTMKTTDFGAVTSRSPVEIYRRFGRTFLLLPKKTARWERQRKSASFWSLPWLTLRSWRWRRVLLASFSCWYLSWLTFRLWRWTWYIPQKGRWTTTGTHDAVLSISAALWEHLPVTWGVCLQYRVIPPNRGVTINRVSNFTTGK
jgi:hypothetical protein